jgi:hypothetical protein
MSRINCINYDKLLKLLDEITFLTHKTRYEK